MGWTGLALGRSVPHSSLQRATLQRMSIFCTMYPAQCLGVVSTKSQKILDVPPQGGLRSGGGFFSGFTSI